MNNNRFFILFATLSIPVDVAFLNYFYISLDINPFEGRIVEIPLPILIVGAFFTLAKSAAVLSKIAESVLLLGSDHATMAALSNDLKADDTIIDKPIPKKTNYIRYQSVYLQYLVSIPIGMIQLPIFMTSLDYPVDDTWYPYLIWCGFGAIVLHVGMDFMLWKNRVDRMNAS